MRAVITVIGHDDVGIIAGLSDRLGRHKVNILEITQSVLSEFFAMIMLVDLARCDIEFGELVGELSAKGKDLGVDVHTMHEDIFNSMHRI